MLRPLCATILVVGLSASALAPASTDDGEAGRRIYLEGLLPDGSPLRAIGAGGAVLVGAQAACVQCHRRSGFGGREGLVRIAPIHGPALFAKPEATWSVRTGRQAPRINPMRHDDRDAYDAPTFARALRSGIDPNGRPLHPLMPRYDLDAPAVRAIQAHLSGLSATPSPGVETRIGEPPILHLATIITPDADPVRARIVAQSLKAWAEGDGIGRVQTRLKVWQLQGPEADWPEQLRRFNQEQPVFAILSGAGASKWEPIRRHCETTLTPCLFPIVDLATPDAHDHFSFFFSTGVPLEARLVASHLNDLQDRSGRLLHIVADETGRAAAGIVSDGLAGREARTLRWPIEPGASPFSLNREDVAIAWLRPEALKALWDAMPQGPGPGQVWLSAQLAPPEQLQVPPAWRAATRWVSVLQDPQALQAKAALGLEPWARRHGLERSNERLLAQVYAAVHFFNDALARTRGQWHQAYLAEVMESSVDGRAAGAVFLGLSLGPGQRVAARAGHLLGFQAPDHARLVPMSGRIVP